MKSAQLKYRVLFAGGGTGGHLFPALAVAEALKELLPEVDILFAGNKKKIEGRIVPKYGYKFKPLWIQGFARRLTLDNVLFPVKLLVSGIQSLLINMKFKPIVAVGSGGYVSGPAIWGAKVMGAKIILLEQNSYPGVTTRMLSKYADEIHLSYEDSKKYFVNKEKLFLTGCPTLVRDKKDQIEVDHRNRNRKKLVVLGGSGGAKSINEAIAQIIPDLVKEDIVITWQTGDTYFENYKGFQKEHIKVVPFIHDMITEYNEADLVIARAGATTIAELSNLGKASILIPSPNVAENHQYFNAKSIADAGGCILIEDKDILYQLKKAVTDLIKDDEKIGQMSKNIRRFGNPQAAKVVAERIRNLCGVES